MIQTNGQLVYEGSTIAAFQVLLDVVVVIPEGPVDPYEMSHQDWAKVQAEPGMSLLPEPVEPIFVWPNALL